MVAFNPDIGDLPSAGMPDQTGASRGSIPDQSFEAMFKGIGSTIEGAAKLADNTVQQFISHDTRTAYEAEMKPVTDSVPVEMKNGVASLGSLQAALEQGKISDVYFYGQLTAMSKGLRAKYPGYEDYVDQAIQSITGVRPANAFRDAVLAEQASNEATLRNEENKWDTWEKQNEAVILQLFPDYFNDPSKYSRESIRQGVASKKSELAQIDQINSETTMLLNQGRLTDEQAKENATVGLNQTVNTFMTGTANAMGFNGSDAMKQIARMQTEGYTDEEYAGLMAQMNQVEGALRYQMSQYLNNPLDPSNPESSFAVILGNEGTAANTLIENAMAPFNAIKQMIVNKEFGLASYYTNLNANMQSKDFNSILNASPELRIANGLSQISPDLAQLFITEGGRQEGIFSQMVPELVARQAIGVDTFEEQVERITNSTSDANSKSSGINSLIDTSLTSIVSGQLAPDQLANAVNGIYGYDDNRSTVFENVNPNDRNRLFTRMYSPEVTQAIVKSGDRKSLMTYYESALENINGIPEFRRAAGTIESMQNWSSKLQLSVNPNTGQIVLNASEMEKAIPEFGAGAAMTRQKIKTLQEGIDSLNNVFSTISPMLDGLEVDEAMKPSLYGEVLKQLNVDLEDGKKDGFFEWLGKTLNLSQLDDKEIGEDGAEVGFSFNESTGDDLGVIAETIMGFEGFSDTAYWDVNANRAGFGSDTVTNEDGTVSKVTADTVVDREAAGRDLSRRLLNEFIPGIVSKVGQEAWSNLTPRTRAALASVAYNYGTLPPSIVRAVKSGDAEAIAKAIEARAVDNEGVNKRRRKKEAELVRSS